MKVTILDKEKEFKNENDVLNNIQTLLNETIIDQDLYFSHMVIDGVEVYNDYELYMEDHLSEIEIVQLIVKSTVEFTNDILTSIIQYSQRALSELKVLTDEFYSNSKSNSWEKLNDLLEALQWIYDAIRSIDKEKVTPSEWDKYLKVASSFELVFPNLLEGLEAQDNILIADIIAYEIIPLFEELSDLN